jgi:hypothetical protein
MFGGSAPHLVGGRRHAGEVLEVPDQVRLVEVAMPFRGSGPVDLGPGVHTPEQPLKPGDPQVLLGRQASVGGEQPDEAFRGGLDATALTAWHRVPRPGGRLVAIDGFWFQPGGPVSGGLFESFYDQPARERLPGWRYFDTEPIVALFERAGFSRVTAASLDEVHRSAIHVGSDQPPYAIVGFAQ